MGEIVMTAQPHPPKAERPPTPPWEKSFGDDLPPPDPELFKAMEPGYRSDLSRARHERHVGYRAKQQSTWLFTLVFVVVTAFFVAAIYFKIWEWRPVDIAGPGL